MMEKLIDLLLKLSDFLIYLARNAWCARVGGAWKRVGERREAGDILSHLSKVVMKMGM